MRTPGEFEGKPCPTCTPTEGIRDSSRLEDAAVSLMRQISRTRAKMSTNTAAWHAAYKALWEAVDEGISSLPPPPD